MTERDDFMAQLESESVAYYLLFDERNVIAAQRDRLAKYIREVETNLPIVHWKKARANHLTDEDMALLDRP